MKATAVMPEPIKQGEILEEPSPETGIIPQKTSSEAEKTSKETSSDELFPETGNSPKEQSLLQDIITLAMKLAVIFAVFWLMFNYIFGVCRYISANMVPSFRDGDLVLYFRMDREFEAGDIAVFSYNERTMMGRVVAVAGDTVDFDEKGMLVNGSHVQEQDIYYETNMYEEGITFPVQVGDNQIFVLGDNRPRATDSRIFGCVDIDEVAGKVIGLLRRRNL